MISIAPKGLTEPELDALKVNLRQLNAKRRRVLLREAYYDGKRRLAEYGISIPPSMRDLETVVGWPAKTCDALASRLHLGGFVMPGSAGVDPELRRIFQANKMGVEWPQAQVSTFINGVSLGAVMRGGAGEPDPLILMMPASEATGIWDVRRRGLSSALWVKVEERKPASAAALFMLDATVEMVRDDRGRWVVQDRIPNLLPRVGVTAVRHRPRMGRPFGHSRITRAVISLTDQAVRTMLRTEVHAEFFSSPQRYAMGADEDAFTDSDGNPRTAWETLLGKIWAIERDEDGNVPTVGQFPQASMQPHNDHLRSIAMMFAGETSLPASSLGIIHDNPASAEAIDAAWADMVGVAELCQDELGDGAVEIAQNALMLSRGMTELDDGLLSLSAKWRDASTPTRAAMSDAVSKQIGVGSLRPDSEVALEGYGYSETDIARIQAEHEAARATDPLAGVTALLNPQPNVAGNTPVPA